VTHNAIGHVDASPDICRGLGNRWPSAAEQTNDRGRNCETNRSGLLGHAAILEAAFHGSQSDT
jgi:hypothetical protein